MLSSSSLPHDIKTNGKSSSFLVDNNYKVESNISHSVESSVLKVKKNDEYYALKQSHSPETQVQLSNEIEILTRLSHPNIIKLVDHSSDKTSIVYPLFDTDLYNYIKDTRPIPVQTRRFIIREIAKALVYLHQQGYTHRDLKIENILLDTTSNTDGIHCVLADFGLAHRLDNKDIPKRGSEEYISPETFHSSDIDFTKVDVWALGVVAFAVATGEMPFTPRSSGRIKMLHRIARGEYHVPKGIELDPNELLFLKSCLKVNPQSRPSAQQVLDSEWLK